MDASCVTCKFSVEGPINPGMDITSRTYECRRMPPQLNLLMGQGTMGQGVISHGAFPPTKADNWCGEYQRRMENSDRIPPLDEIEEGAG